MNKTNNKALSPKTKGTPGAIHAIPVAAEKPDNQAIAWQRLATGMKFGWLTVLEAPVTSQSPTLARCTCGAVVTPRAAWIAQGTFRSCGSLEVHGRH